MREVIAQRRADPRDPDTDLITGLLEARLDGEPLTDDQMAGTLRLLFAAGHGTTTNALGSLIRYFADHPDEQEWLRENPDRLPHAIEEILRVWSPSRGLSRIATMDTEFGGRSILAGERMTLMWASGNRDESVFADAGTVSRERREKGHIAFGTGIHTCLGAALARAELRIFGEELLARTSRIVRDGDVVEAGWPHVGPESMTIAFEPADPSRRVPAASGGTQTGATPNAAVPTAAAAATDELPAVVVGRRVLTPDVVELTLAASGGLELTLAASGGAGPLPAWEPGAHADLVLPNGLVRQYPLRGDPGWSGVWRVAVLREPDGRGGSAFVHDDLALGSELTVRVPRNHFRFGDAHRYVFIAGGVGVTPLLPMIQAAQARGADWSLLYLGRHRESMAYASDLVQSYGDRVQVVPTREAGRPDIAALLRVPTPETMVFCCGPQPLIDAVEQAGAACLEGTCGSCESVVLEGTPAHRDSVLTAADRADGRYIMPCVSRSCTPRLALDL